MFCSNCGAKLIENAKFCASCGHPVGDFTQEPNHNHNGTTDFVGQNFVPPTPNSYGQHNNVGNNQPYGYHSPNHYNESGSMFGWGVLGFFVCVVGLILFLVWRQERPRASKAAGIGALIGVIFYFIFGIIYSVIIVNLVLNYNVY